MPQPFRYWGKWQRHREEGHKNSLGYNDQIHHNLYSSILPSFSWDPGSSVKHTHHGGVFNLEFSPDGSLLVAATERKSILLFDPLNHKLINYVDQAHNDCVNYARFLDSRMFATCSDDTTVALWDVRYLKHKIRSLKGHSNWVKNIEFASNAGLLVTSGFDGSIYTWDINRYSEGDVQFQRVFHTTGLMRMRLTPDNTKMVICTTGGYLMVVHNLDLNTLASDLQGFKPNMYRLMQMGNAPFPICYSYNHLFTTTRNKVELISDFPRGNDAEVISSLQIHPQGWCSLSRNTSSDENSEWTCLHDIQDVVKNEENGKGDEEEEKADVTFEDQDLSHPVPDPVSTQDINEGSSRTEGRRYETEVNRGESSRLLREQPVVHIRLNYGRTPSSQDGSPEQRHINSNIGTSTESFRFGNIELHISRRRLGHFSSSSRVSSTVSGNNQTVAVSSSTLSDTLDSEPSRPPTGNPTDESSSGSEDSGNSSNAPVIVRDRPAFFIRTGTELGAHTFLLLGPNRAINSEGRSYKIHKNVHRLHHYINEPNVGRGFIKELCFSTDGRLICSPFGYGVRLLSFNASCSELCDSIPETQASLWELATNLSHHNYVVSTKFSPTHCLLVSGCLSGKICFHQPLY